jgi:ATP synthase protein I
MGSSGSTRKRLDTTRQRISDEVGGKEVRKLRARRQKGLGAWFGVGMFGLVGWAVSIPTVLGTALGLWVDREFPSRYSWTLMGLMAGVIWGCINAWYWVKRESRRED